MKKKKTKYEDLDIEILETKKNKKDKNKSSSHDGDYVFVTYVILLLLIALCSYYVYYVQVKSETFINSAYNRRLDNLSSRVIRGDIITEDGITLATTKASKNGYVRSYPQGRKYSHVVGFSSHGMSGIEKDNNFLMLRSHSFILKRLKNEVFNQKNIGDKVVTTLNSKVQNTAYDGLAGYEGAVIAMDPKTGDIICNVSKPDFDPNEIDYTYDSIASDSNSSVLVNRATQGLYPPGSTFKILTALEYIQEGHSANESFYCNGAFKKGEMEIHCFKNKVHGEETFISAFANSCNSVFAEIGLMLNKGKYIKLANSLLFNKNLPTDISNVSKSKFTIDKSTGDYEMMQTAIGQGNTLVTPLHMLMIASAIENDGVLVKPKIIKEIVNEDNEKVRNIKSDTYGSILSEKDAKTLREYMRAVVTEGTSTTLNNMPYTAYGKTGTAEFSSNKNEAHSWFVGFAEYEDRQIAVCVIMEKAGAGSSYALPLAKEVFNAYFNNP